MDNLRKILKRINMNGQLHYNEPMSQHTTFETGGPADIFYAPADADELKTVLEAARKTGTPHYIIGGGANLLVSDRGLRGIVIDTRALNTIINTAGGSFICGAGAVMDKAAEAALESGRSGFDSFYGMPGTIGGAVWMNARCYGKSISDLIVSVKYLDSNLKLQTLKKSEMQFEYKKSVFQNKDWIILNTEFFLEPGDKKLIRENMQNNRIDRQNKGHYAGPSAGSVFKNNRAFGKPSGEIIDSLGLRGTSVGGAVISEQHANIFLNTGNATSADIFKLIKLTAEKVKTAYGWELETEVQLIGDFTDRI